MKRNITIYSLAIVVAIGVALFQRYNSTKLVSAHDQGAIAFMLPEGWAVYDESVVEGLYTVNIEDADHTLLNFYLYDLEYTNTHREILENHLTQVTEYIRDAGGEVEAQAIEDIELFGGSASHVEFLVTIEASKSDSSLYTFQIPNPDYRIIALLQHPKEDQARVHRSVPSILESIVTAPKETETTTTPST